MEKVNPKLLDQCMAMACDDCKKKIGTLASKLSKWDMLRPHRLASKFLNALCKDCKGRLVYQVAGKRDLS